MDFGVDPRIRKYQREDREDVWRIAANTAFFGEPVEAYLDDRKLFCDVFYAYYTDLEPDYGWVATWQDRAIGFLMGCPDTRHKGTAWLRSIFPAVTIRILRGGYHLGWKTQRYAISLFRVFIHGEFPHVDLTAYPAHLHVNIEAEWRGHGLGRQLIKAYIQQISKEGIAGVHLMTTSLNTAACHLYEKMGFVVLDKRKTSFWRSLTGQTVENLCYGLDVPIDEPGL